jgi:hypothetical protein
MVTCAGPEERDPAAFDQDDPAPIIHSVCHIICSIISCKGNGTFYTRGIVMSISLISKNITIDGEYTGKYIPMSMRRKEN